MTSVKQVIAVIICLILLQGISWAQTSMWAIHDPCYGSQELYLDDTVFPSDSLSSVSLKVVYRYSFLQDTLNQTTVRELMLLEVGSNLSKYGSYERFQLDSILKNRSDFNTFMGAMKVLPNKQIVPVDFFESVFQNYPEGRETVIGRIVATDFIYDEPIPDFMWKITGEMDSCCGYVTHKAICSFRGRDYEAWFTLDIPVSFGPWKFNGLPGLILKVSDSEQNYNFEAIRLSNREQGTTIGMPQYAFRKTNRKAYLEAKSQIIANYQLYQRYYNNGTGIIVSPRSDYKKQTLRNDLIEKE